MLLVVSRQSRRSKSRFLPAPRLCTNVRWQPGGLSRKVKFFISCPGPKYICTVPAVGLKVREDGTGTSHSRLVATHNLPNLEFCSRRSHWLSRLFSIPRPSTRRRRCASTTPAIRISGFSLPDPPPLRPRTSRRSCLSVTGCGCQARPFHPRHPPPCLGIRGLKVAAGSCPVCSTWNECFRAWERAERRRELVAHVLFAAPQTYNFG